MVTMHAPAPRLSLDGKRIAANSFVIALHVAAVMLLLAPVSAPLPVAEKETTTTVIFQDPIKIPPPTPPPPDPRPHTITQQTPIRTPVAAPPEQADVVYDTPSDVGFAAAEIPTTPTDFGGSSQPTIQSLMTDRAPAPPYPPMAIRRHITGTVVLMILVDAAGNPAQVDIEQSSGSTLLDEAAQKFIRARWHFVPAQQGGVAVSAYARVPINFNL